MEPGTYARQRLASFHGCSLGDPAILYLAFGDIALAQDGGPRQSAAPRFSKIAHLIPGDTAWMLTSVALVLMMTIPGLGLFMAAWCARRTLATR